MAVPTFTLPTTGIDPKITSKEVLEENVNLVLSELNSNLENYTDTSIGGVIIPSVNLFNKDDPSNEVGFQYRAGSGAKAANVNYAASHLIAVEEGLQYSVTDGSTMAFFDSSGTYVSGYGGEDKTYTAPSGAAFAGFSIDLRVVTIDLFMVSQSDAPLPWQPYGATIPSSAVTDVSGEAVEDFSISAKKLSFAVQGKNLFDKSKASIGYFMNTFGIISVNATYYYSDLIDVVEGETYWASSGSEPNGFRTVTAYDSTGSVVSEDGVSSTSGSYTVPSGITQIRFSSWVSGIDDMMVEVGPERTDFEPYGFYFEGILGEEDAADVTHTDALINRETLRHCMYQMGLLNSGSTNTYAQLNIVAVGDSYTQLANRWVTKVTDQLIEAYGDGGGGWTGYGFFGIGTTPYVIGGSQPTGINGNARPDLYGVAYEGDWIVTYVDTPSPDMGLVTSSTVGDMIQRTVPDAPNHTLLRVLYLATAAGSVQHRVNGGSWTSETLTGSVGEIGYFDIPLTSYNGVAKTVEIEVVSGEVKLCGDNAMTTAYGIRFHKCGCSGSKVSSWAGVDASQQQAAWALLEADCFTLMDGTNSQTSGTGVSTWRGYMETVIGNMRASVGFPDILVVMPPENMRDLTPSMSSYSAEGRKMAIAETTGFLDLQPSFGVNPEDYEFGSTFPLFNIDGIHPETFTGGYVMASAISDALKW